MNEKTDEAMSEAERDMLDTVECGRGVCPREVFEPATVDVVVGEVTKLINGKDYRVKSPQSFESPNREKWCIDCAESVFGVTEVAGQRQGMNKYTKYITPELVLPFLGGALIAFVIAMIITV